MKYLPVPTEEPDDHDKSERLSLPAPAQSRGSLRARTAGICGLASLAALLVVGAVLSLPMVKRLEPLLGENHQKRIFEQTQAEAMHSGTHTKQKGVVSYLHVEQRLRAKLGARHFSAVANPQDYEPLPTLREVVAKELGLQTGELLDTREGRRRLASVSTSGGANAEVMTVENTVPIRIHVDYASLYPATARPYSQCFKVNDWFKWNFPTTQKPPDVQAGGRICNRGIDPSAQTPGCWGRCTKEDTLTVAMRTYMMNEISTAVTEAQTYVRVRKNKGTLTLVKSTGAYQHIYQGYRLPEANFLMCAKDSQLMYNIPVDDKYCNEGVNADVILFPQMAQYISGVVGWGADTERDQYGRPLTIAMGWSVPASASRRTKGGGRRVTLHEVVHGLSFAIWQFQSVVDASGVKKDLTEMVKMTDTDGTTDNIWHFKGDRVRSVASAYYNCDKKKLKSLPLMGQNSLGAGSRGSHWETRIMYDEFMSYGSGEAVSGFTLAVFEDMGLYLGNYSNSQCLTWGRHQGCDFISSRCGKRSSDKSHAINVGSTAATDCSRTYKWKYTAITNTKCAAPDCKAVAVTENGVPKIRCNAECVPPSVKGGRDDCGKAPPGYVLASGLQNIDWGNLIQNYDWSYLGIMLIWTLSMTWNIAKCAHRDKHNFLKQVFTLISMIFLMIAVVPLAVGVYFLVAYEVWSGWVSYSLIAALCGSGGFLFVFTWYGLTAVSTETRGKIFIYELCMLGGLVLQSALLYIVITWVRSTYNFETDSFSVLSGKKATVIVEVPHVDTAVQEVENYSCQTYRRCCGSGAPGTEGGRCTAVHSGQSQGAAAAAMRDPSSPKFCELLTGSKTANYDTDYAVCTALESQGVIASLDECKKDFCSSGVKGYETFISAMMKWVRSNLVPLVFLIAGIALLQIIQIFIGLVMFVQAHELHTGSKAGPALGMFSRRWQLPHEELEKRQAKILAARGGKTKGIAKRAGAKATGMVKRGQGKEEAGRFEMQVGEEGEKSSNASLLRSAIASAATLKSSPYYDCLHVDGFKRNILMRRADFGAYEAHDEAHHFEHVKTVWAAPRDADKPLTNGQELEGQIVVCERGHASQPWAWLEKAENAQDAGAIALIVVNTEDRALPMTAGEEDSEHISIPVVSVPHKFTKLFVHKNGTISKATLSFETGDAYVTRQSHNAKLDAEQLTNPLFAAMSVNKLNAVANKKGMHDIVEAKKPPSWYNQSFAKYHKQHERHFTNTIIAINFMYFFYMMYETNYLIEDTMLNPSFGPSGATLIDYGAKSNKEINSGEYYRLFTSMFLHTGVIHLICSSAGLHHIGGGTEQDYGHFTVVFIYLLSGYFGTVVSALFLPDYVTVGAGGAVFGLFGACVADVVQNWGVTRRKGWLIFQLTVVIGIQLYVGLMPLVDNFCNIGGFVCGFLCGLWFCVEERVDAEGNTLGQRCYQVPIEFLAFFSVFALVGGATFLLLMGADLSDCEMCQYVNCVSSLWSCSKYDELTKSSTIKPVINCDIETFANNNTFSLTCPAASATASGAKFWIDDAVGKAGALCSALCRQALARAAANP